MVLLAFEFITVIFRMLPVLLPRHGVINKLHLISVIYLYIKVKGKASSLDIAPLTILDSGALQPRKWQLTDIDWSTAAQAVASQSPR